MAKLGVLASVEVVPGRATEWETILKNEWTLGPVRERFPWL